MMDVEEVAAIVVDTGFRLHRRLGPGLLESVYEAVLARMLERRALRVERRKCVAFKSRLPVDRRAGEDTMSRRR
jgi:GxxExxY protein